MQSEKELKIIHVNVNNFGAGGFVVRRDDVAVVKFRSNRSGPSSDILKIISNKKEVLLWKVF